jgi:hypothetical protein
MVKIIVTLLQSFLLSFNLEILILEEHCFLYELSVFTTQNHLFILNVLQEGVAFFNFCFDLLD